MREYELIKVLKYPYFSEKSFRMQKNSVITMVVDRNASKEEIAKAVELVYGKKVIKVNTINCKGKSRRFGKFTGKNNDWKKAHVTMEEGAFDVEAESLDNVDQSAKVAE